MRCFSHLVRTTIVMDSKRVVEPGSTLKFVFKVALGRYGWRFRWPQRANRRDGTRRESNLVGENIDGEREQRNIENERNQAMQQHGLPYQPLTSPARPIPATSCLLRKRNT